MGEGDIADMNRCANPIWTRPRWASTPIGAFIPKYTRGLDGLHAFLGHAVDAGSIKQRK